MKFRKKIEPAARLSNVKEYYFSRKLKEIAALRDAGEDIISLAIGGPDLPPPPAAVDAAIETLKRPDTHGYQPTVGIPDLRKAFAGWYRDFYGVDDIDPDTELLPLIGSKEGIINISMAFLNPGDGVLVPDPGYPTYTSASNLVQAEIFTYTLKEENGWQPDFEELEKLPLDKIKLMWVNYPHMPTGTPASLNTFRKLVDFSRKYGILIVNDNPYSFILNSKPLSLMQIDGAKDTCIEINSLSKCLNLSGWRVGMLVSNPEFVSWVLKVKSNMDSGQPRAIMEGAVAALQQPRSWYEQLNAIYASRQKSALKIMDALGCRCADGQQGLFLWGRIPDGEENSEKFADKILDSYKIFLTPGFIFGKEGERYIRISLCAPEEVMKKALKRIIDDED